MALLNRDDLVPDDIQREKARLAFRRRAMEIVRKEIAQKKKEQEQYENLNNLR